MALETLKDLNTTQSGVSVSHHGAHYPPTNESYVSVDHTANKVTFKIQEGPIKDCGLNGCQVTDMIEVARSIIAGLDERFPCPENEETLKSLTLALMYQRERTFNREARGVEGHNRL